jgi:hypothetical protein
MIDAAIELYHDMLLGAPAMALESQRLLEEGLRAENLYFGDRPLCGVLRPHMITMAQFDAVRRACHDVISATLKLGEAMLRDESLAEPLRLSPAERRLAAIDPGYPAISAISRLDAFLAGAELKFIEYNAETPAGGAYTDALADVFGGLPIVRRFLAEGGFALHTFEARKSTLDLLLDCYKAWGGRDAPSLAIVDWAGLPTATEFDLFHRYFERRGQPTLIVDPRALEYSGGVLRHGDSVINLVYKRVLVHELLQREDEVRPLLRAYEDGAVCMVNAPRAKLFHKKAIFALLTDERLQAGFSPAERAAIRRHVPWTRRLADGPTTFEGKRVDLLEMARTRRDRFILKPNDEYGGKGVVVGWEGDDAAWEAALGEALGGDYVIQERVAVARAAFPYVEAGQVRFQELSIDMDPYIIAGQADGFLTRVAGTTLLNVTAGGGSTVPTFVLQS